VSEVWRVVDGRTKEPIKMRAPPAATAATLGIVFRCGVKPWDNNNPAVSTWAAATLNSLHMSSHHPCPTQHNPLFSSFTGLLHRFITSLLGQFAYP